MDRDRGAVPALRAVPSPTGPAGPVETLPGWLTSFVGRDRELEEIGRRLSDHRLVTLVGAGGSGKTRLAIVAAERLRETGVPRVFLVEFAPVSDRTAVDVAVADAIGVVELDAPVREVVASHLGDTPALLVLDNCEHVTGAVVELVDELLGRCAQLTILATSREPLGLDGEMRWQVPPLSVPSPSTWERATGALRHDAVKLLRDRARLIRPDFDITDANAAVVSEICRLVDGLPLAIELVASRLSAMTLPDILERLSSGRSIPGRQRPDVHPRHLDLEALLQWSYELLAPDQRTLLRRMSVFAGPADLHAVEHVCAGQDLDRDAVLGLLADLIDRSLVVADERDGRAHYRLLRTVHRFATSKHLDGGEEEVATVRARHLDWLLTAYGPEDPGFLGPGTHAWTGRLGTVMEDAAAAFAWARRHAPDGALRLGWWLLTVTMVRGLPTTQLHEQLRQTVDATADGPSTAERARALNVLSWDLDVFAAQRDEAVRLCTEALRIAQALDDQQLEADTLWSLGDIEIAREHPEAALENYQRAQRLFASLGQPLPELRTVKGMGEAALLMGDLDLAEEWFDEALRIARDEADPNETGSALRMLAAVARERGDLQRAAGHLHDAHDLIAMTPALWDLAVIQTELAEVAADTAEAARLVAQALLPLHQAGAAACVNRALIILAADAVQQGDGKRAARLLGAASTLPDPDFSCGMWGPRTLASLRERRTATNDRARRLLREDAFTATHLAGQELSHDEAVREALMGVALTEVPRTSTATGDRAALGELRRIGQDWAFTWTDTSITVRDAKGIAYLARLLAQPGREFHALDLSAGSSPTVGPLPDELSFDSGHAGELLDVQAKEAYRRRLRDLAEELDEADRYGDPERARRAQDEIDAITQQLASAFGLGGRARRASDGNERARKAVSKCLRDSIHRLEDLHPPLGRHLTASIRTGIYCSYQPERATTWIVSTGQ